MSSENNNDLNEQQQPNQPDKSNQEINQSDQKQIQQNVDLSTQIDQKTLEKLSQTIDNQIQGGDQLNLIQSGGQKLNIDIGGQQNITIDKPYNPFVEIIEKKSQLIKQYYENITQTKDEQNLQQNKSRSRSRSRSKSNDKKFFKPCCGHCKKNDKGGKTCICVVPARQRRTVIGPQGCSTCGCQGCSREDFELKNPTQGGGLISSSNNYEQQSQQQYDQYKEQQYKEKSPSQSDSNFDFEMRNGCCKKCLKAFSKTNKACICQVPKSVRKTILPPEGCKYCGCKGCNPEDTRGLSPDRDWKKKRSIKKRSQSKSQESESEEIDFIEYNFNNFDKSSIGLLISNQLSLYPPLIGFGIPQRTASYILGKPKKQY